MRWLFNSLFGYFLSPGGIVLLAALDSSLVFFLPLGIDFVVILLAARKPELFWMYALLATAGSLLGAGVTYWIGAKVGEHGLKRLVNPSRLARVEQRVNGTAAYSVAALAVIPPPFPFTAFILTSGAFRVHAAKFFGTLAGVRLLRFMAEAALAARYGGGIVNWMESPTFKAVVVALAGVAVAGTIVSAIAMARKGRRKGRDEESVPSGRVSNGGFKS